MGTLSSKKFIKNSSGTLAEENALTTSAGAGDADKIPALNASGVLDASIVNATTSSVGAADAGKVAALDGSGRLDTSVLPVGIGADTVAIVASENLAAGDLINVWNDGGTAKIRKADASTQGKDAQGFVLASVTSGNSGTVYFEGSNTQMTSLTPGLQFLSSTTPGKTTTTAPTAAGTIVQRVGFATSDTSMNFQSNAPVLLA
jgi:hypothetical protein